MEVAVGLQMGFAMLLVEGLKQLVWKYWPKFNIDPKWYLVATPVANALVALLFAVLAFGGYTLPTDWTSWAQALGQVFVTSLVTAWGYNNTIKPYKEADKTFQVAEAKALKVK